MKKLVAVVVMGALLVPLMASPALAWRGGGWHGRGGCCWGGFGVGVGVGVLATTPFWYPRYAYPAYAYPADPYPAYPYPAYGYPAYSYPAYPIYPTPIPPPPPAPPADAGAAVQSSQSTNMVVGTPVSSPPVVLPAPTAGESCATVTIDGHNETRTLSTGQTVTAWIPTSTQQVCR